MNVRRIILGAVISAGSLLGAACTTGGDEAPVVAGAGDAAADSTRGDVNTPDDTSTSGPSNDPYVRALAAVLRDPIEGRDRSGFSEDQIACLAPRIVAIYTTTSTRTASDTP